MHKLLRPLAGLALVFLALALLTRLVLMFAARSGLEPQSVLLALPMGLCYDLAALVFFLLPLVLLVACLPARRDGAAVASPLLMLLVTPAIALLLFVAVAEWLFWDEFGVRFNFIAVDYLVYTNEVIGNIWQSYPMPLILGGLSVLTLWLLFALRRFWQRPTAAVGWRQRLLLVIGFVLLALADFTLFDADRLHLGDNAYADQLGRNGLYQFFSAYRNAELSYHRFYPIETDPARLDRQLRALVGTPEAHFQSDHGIERDIVNPGPERHPNIVLISVESLSAEFLGASGNTQNLTPNLDRLAAQSHFFSRLYATGNRTVRGLEALSIGVPPSPGEAIVKRPHNQRLFSLGSVLAAKGYQNLFLYGGYSYFDNMRAFFEANAYQVIDRTALTAAQIHHETIWGVADEDLFSLALSEFDQRAASGRPFFGQVMTVSNHRPFTYPEGRIDIPSKSSREGAVKYTDWAIGDFIERARSKPWFANTVFLIVADHCAASAGRVDLPIERYHIPALIYWPGQVAPARDDRLMSQIDLAPTLLGVLGMSYRSQFFGYDMARLQPGRERALIATYQQLGLFRDGVLSILKPTRKQLQLVPSANGLDATPLYPPRPELIEQAITWYQSSSDLFDRGELHDHADPLPR